MALLQGNPAEAAKLYAQALKLDPRSATAATCLGVARLALGDTKGAEPHLRTAVRLEPKNAEIWNQLATLLSSDGRYDEAIKCHRQAVTLNPKIGAGLAWLRFDALQPEPFAEALEREQRAIAADPAYAPAAAAMPWPCKNAIAWRRRCANTRSCWRRIPVSSRSRATVCSRSITWPGKRRRICSPHTRLWKPAETGAPPPVFANSPDSERKLRVALFSEDFREHSVAYFLEPLLRFARPGPL